MAFSITDPSPATGSRDALRVGARIFLVLASIFLLSMLVGVQAQEATPSAAQSGEATPTAQTPPAVSGAEAEPAPAPIPAEGGASPSQSSPARGAEAAAPPALAPEALEPVAGSPAASGEAAGPTPPPPSLFDDPAGAISHLLTPPERDPNLPHDLSPHGMFMAADWVVKAVMIGLAFASLATWTIWLAKSVEIACARARAKRALAALSSAGTIGAAGRSLAGRGGPAAFMVRSAEEELRQSAPALDHAGDTGVKERVGLRLSRIEAQAGRRLARGAGVLATIGSTAPFVGLFGTVWGIMNAFIGISESQTTNLAVVAPGIAEALLATAIGLVAAIPAVMIYNVFARSIAGYRQLLADAAATVERLVSLSLDLRKAPKSAGAVGASVNAASGGWAAE